MNARTVKPSYKLRATDEIEVELTPPPSTAFRPGEYSARYHLRRRRSDRREQACGYGGPPGRRRPVRHPGQRPRLSFSTTVHTQGGDARPGIVHRLDKDTSGLLVVAKNEETHESLADQFRAREVFKSYAGSGPRRRPSGAWHRRSAAGPRPTASHAHGSGAWRPAGIVHLSCAPADSNVLRYSTWKSRPAARIRFSVHLAWLKHPVVADEAYGEGRDNSVQRRRSCGRQSAS